MLISYIYTDINLIYSTIYISYIYVSHIYHKIYCSGPAVCVTKIYQHYNRLYDSYNNNYYIAIYINLDYSYSLHGDRILYVLVNTMGRVSSIFCCVVCHSSVDSSVEDAPAIHQGVGLEGRVPMLHTEGERHLDQHVCSSVQYYPHRGFKWSLLLCLLLPWQQGSPDFNQ